MGSSCGCDHMVSVRSNSERQQLKTGRRFGVQTYFGSQHLSIMFRCIFGDSWWNMPNHLPADAGITSRDLLVFFLFWLMELPFQAVHPTKIKYLFAVRMSLDQMEKSTDLGYRLNPSYAPLPASESLPGVSIMGVVLEWTHLVSVNTSKVVRWVGRCSMASTAVLG